MSKVIVIIGTVAAGVAAICGAICGKGLYDQHKAAAVRIISDAGQT